MTRLVLLSLAVLLAAGFAPAEWQDFAVCLNDPADPWPHSEGDEAINEAKREPGLAGATVHAYFRNTGTDAATLGTFTWNDVPMETIQNERTLVWSRLTPQTAPPGSVAELTLRLRTPVRDPGILAITLSNGIKALFEVAPAEPVVRIESMAFTADLRTAYLYVEAQHDGLPLPRELLVDGAAPEARVRWLGDGYAGRTAVARVDFDNPLTLGERHCWTVAVGEAHAGASVRTFADVSRFGTYGTGDFDRYAGNGLDAYCSFGQVEHAALDSAAALGIAVSFYVSDGTPPEDVRDHPAVYGFNLMDEPDVHDYSRLPDVPMHLRPGTLAPDLVPQARACETAAPGKPVLLTLDLTFTPANYYIYGQMADITTPDCYPVTIGKPLTFLRDCVAHVKRATAPRPFGFIYQSCWEQYAKADKPYVGAGELRERGFDTFVDRGRVRGLGRPPAPEEIRIQTAYAVGAGARALWAYIDATELVGTLLFRSTQDLPENWNAVGEMSRTYRNVRDALNLAHPVAWARTDQPRVWVRTLLCGEKDVLVVLVNESCVSDDSGFHSEDVDATVSLPDLPWLKAESVERLSASAAEPVSVARDGGVISWPVNNLHDTALFRVR